MEQIVRLYFIEEKMDVMFGSKEKNKPMTLNSINGVCSEISLVCLFLVLQIVSFLSLSTLQNVYLLKANQQNILQTGMI